MRHISRIACAFACLIATGYSAAAQVTIREYRSDDTLLVLGPSGVEGGKALDLTSASAAARSAVRTIRRT